MRVKNVEKDKPNSMDKIKKHLADWGATIAGLIAAGVVGWQDIDWATFDLKRDKVKLIIMFAIAAGGYLSKFKTKKKDDSTSDK